MLDRLLYFIERWRMRLSKNEFVDLLEQRQSDGSVILWPISKRAYEVMRKEVTYTAPNGKPAKPPRKRGGYHVPYATREEIHHNHLPLIASLACLNLTIVDTN